MMLEYPQWDTTDCRINATYDRIMARREAEPGTENLPLERYGRRFDATSLRGRVATLTLVVVAVLMWRLVL